MPDRKVTADACLARAEFLEMRGDYVGSIQAVNQGLCEDPEDARLRKKREDLLSIICWRC